MLKKTVYVNASGDIIREDNVLVNEDTGEIFDSETGDILHAREVEAVTIESESDSEEPYEKEIKHLPSALPTPMPAPLPTPSRLPTPNSSNVNVTKTVKEPESIKRPIPIPSTTTIPVLKEETPNISREEVEEKAKPSPLPAPSENALLKVEQKEESIIAPSSPMPAPSSAVEEKPHIQDNGKPEERALADSGIQVDNEEYFNDYENFEPQEIEDDEDYEVFPSISSEDGEGNLKEKIRKSKWEAGGRPSENKAKIPEIINIESWTEDTSSDPHIGLGSENDITSKENKPKVNRKIVLNERDYIMMSFMTRYRYCYSDQLSRLVGAENKDVRARLSKLEKEGYIRREVITRGQDLWLTRKAGLQMIGSPYAAIGKGQVSTLYIQHTIGVGNLGVELEMLGEGKNILGEPDFPKTNRYPYGIYNPDEAPSLTGEMTITEREIRSANRVLKGGNTVTTLDLKNKVENVLSKPEPVERLEGNEWMFVVYGKGEHFPDLVIHRDRDADGKPQHIAVELELTAKDLPSWRRILKWYKEYGIMYSKVYYFTHNRTIATRLNKVIEELKMEDFVVVRKYVPANNRGPFWG